MTMIDIIEIKIRKAIDNLRANKPVIAYMHLEEAYELIKKKTKNKGDVE